MTPPITAARMTRMISTPKPVWLTDRDGHSKCFSCRSRPPKQVSPGWGLGFGIRATVRVWKFELFEHSKGRVRARVRIW